tara:strand:- start:699 stop:929 length:231 start_codon:yes stop_codon:yes gene_type:complete
MKTKGILIILLFLLISFSSEAQCAMCRAVLESEEGSEMAKGVNNGIMYLMIFPYLLVGGIGYVVYRNRQKAKQLEN